jgi:2-hydroxy-3-keto-5-methylthiopentenyl-1-phosphate phosphatase
MGASRPSSSSRPLIPDWLLLTDRFLTRGTQQLANSSVPAYKSKYNILLLALYAELVHNRRLIDESIPILSIMLTTISIDPSLKDFFMLIESVNNQS